MREIELTYARRLLELWKTGTLHRDWYARYDGLFDENDLKVVQNQHKHGWHFGEWFTAIHFWKRGYKVLIEKYAFANQHRRKFEIVAALVGRRGMRVLAHPTPRVQPPDLFIYDEDLGVYFFAEVKRDKDRLALKQRHFFKMIEQRLSCQVLVAYMKAR